MYKFIITFISVLSITTFLNAAVIKKIEIDGNKRISNETIKIYGNINANKDYS